MEYVPVGTIWNGVGARRPVLKILASSPQAVLKMSFHRSAPPFCCLIFALMNSIQCMVSQEDTYGRWVKRNILIYLSAEELS